MEKYVYETLSELVLALPFDECYTMIIIDHHERQNKGGKLIELNRVQINPRKWKLYQNTRMFRIFESHPQDDILETLHDTILKLSLRDANKIIIDGLISYISILYSDFLHKETIVYDRLNFRKIYLLLKELAELGNICINERSDIWRIVDKIYLPYVRKANFDMLVETMSGENVSCDAHFVSLQEVLELFEIKKV